MTADHFNDLPGARTVDTTYLLLAEENIRDAIDARAMTLVTGAPGTGKSHATAVIASGVTDRVTLFVEGLVTPNPRSLANLVLEGLTGVPHDDDRFIATAAVIEMLEQRPSVVFLDEAQRLTLLCLEWVRYVHEHVRGRVPLVIVGGPLAHQRLQRDHQLWRRFICPTFFDRIPSSRMPAVARSFHPIWELADPKDIRFADRYLRGNFGAWAKVTGQLLRLQQRLPAGSSVDRQLIRMALQRDRFC